MGNHVFPCLFYYAHFKQKCFCLFTPPSRNYSFCFSLLLFLSLFSANPYWKKDRNRCCLPKPICPASRAQNRSVFRLRTVHYETFAGASWKLWNLFCEFSGRIRGH